MSDWVPEGTAAWSNKWRQNYRTMPFAKHQSDTDAIMLAHATPEQHIINSTDLRRCLATIDCAGKRVIEFGGWRGAMANAVLSEFPDLAAWRNHEICPSAQRDDHCRDPRYECVVADRFVWETPRPSEGDIFVTSHSIEHITAEHLGLLFKWLPDSIKWMYLCAPIPDSCEDNKWDGYGGTHILEIGWAQIIRYFIPDSLTVDSGPEFRWLQRLNK